MTDTRDKLLEAKYFLERMKENQSERVAFKNNLSAFLSAARSVTFIMQEEFDKAPGFKNWYINKQIEMRSDDVMRFLCEKRNMTIHKKPVRPHAGIKVCLSEHIAISESISIVCTRANGTVEKWESEPLPSPVPAKTEATTEWRWYFHDLPEKDVVTVCEEYMVKLNALIVECKSKFLS